MLLQAVGAKDDPASHGRQMPSHWSSRKLNIVSQGSPTGTQCLHAIGVAEAGLLYEQVETIPDRESKFHADEVVYCSLGDGATSEGEFWESLNTASMRQLPVVYLVEDNGYAISVPVEAQTPGGAISIAGRSLPAPEGPARRRLRLPCQLPRDAGGRAVGTRTPRSRARARIGGASVLPLAVG